MTENEHKLMVYMFARQTMLISSLIQVLKSRRVLEPDDIEAYESLTRETEIQNHDILVSVASQYQSYAKELGLEESLPRTKKS